MSRKIKTDKIASDLHKIVSKAWKIGIKPETCNQLETLITQVELELNEAKKDDEQPKTEQAKNDN
jgi:hypothetical protein